MVLGIAVTGWRYFTGKTETTESKATPDSKRKILYWTDPMKPDYRSDKPGKSPFMDMELVPVYDDAQGGASVAGGTTPGMEEVETRREQRPRTPGATDETGAVVVSVRPEIVQNLGVRTYTVTRGSQPRRVTATGYLFRDAQGGASVAGAPFGEANNARRTPGATDARGLAVLVDLIDRDASLVRAGQHAEVRVADVPDRIWGGTVEEVESDVDIGTRTVKARIRLSQPSAVLKPNMFAEAAILGAASGKSALFIPREALIRTGTRNAVVLALGEGRFQPVEVTPGVESDDWIEIRHGIKESDVVVTSGQFLIDSEASVRASFQRMTSDQPGTATQENPHAGH
jgi:Cu(I)/Ag(I) efflux system membrane fusion protein